jgi:hypothetical protein
MQRQHDSGGVEDLKALFRLSFKACLRTCRGNMGARGVVDLEVGDVSKSLSPPRP